MEKNKFEIDFLADRKNYYLFGNPHIDFLEFKEGQRPDIALYQIDEISYEDKAPRKEALENVLSALRIEGVNFIYLILGDETGVHFYYGVARDYSKNIDMDLSIYDIGKYILEPSIKGNFRGSLIREVNREEKPRILKQLSTLQYCSMLEGVPGYTKEDEKFQGVDRLVDVMLGDEFAFLIVASALDYDNIKEIEKNLYETYTRLVPLAKQSIQSGESSNTGKSTGKTSGSSKSVGQSETAGYQKSTTSSQGKSFGTSNTESTSTTKGTSKTSGGSSSSSGTSESGQRGKSEGKTEQENTSTGTTEGESSSKGTNTSQGTNESSSEQSSTGTGVSSSITIESVDKKSQDWIKYLDDVIIPRLDYGTGKGIFLTASFLASTSKAKLKKLENTAVSLYSGEKGNKVPLKAVSLDNSIGKKKLSRLRNFQLPIGKIDHTITEQEAVSRSALSQFVQPGSPCRLGNWITTNELAMIAGLPQKEVVGLGLNEEVEFGLNFQNHTDKENQICLGKLVQSGNILEQMDVFLDKRNLDKHVFVTGVTGSGKTTTCHKILIDSDIPFLVIEPAKTEYRILADKYEDLLVFTLGRDDVAPFRLNPFEFFPHESITSRVDMIMASIEASFDMEAAIPQLIETAIYECYSEYGWNISSNRNSKYGKSAFDEGIYAFPTLEDLVLKVDDVVKRQGFDSRLENDYIGSIKARLQGLIIGSKGLMLNTKRSVDFKDLLSKRVILEFEEIRSGSEKSLIMGFVLTNLMEAIKANYLENGAYQHITLVEEAHRLLSKYTPGDSPNKKHGVETFSDMLAEIRKYGESLIIVDQIPNKLTPEVLKNTNTKIVHRLFAEDDKNAIGNTIVLKQEQKEFLSKLDTGRAVVFTPGLQKAVQVQINNLTNTTSNEIIEDSLFKARACRYYADHYRKGIIEGTQLLFDSIPTIEQMEMVMELSKENIGEIIHSFLEKRVCQQMYLESLRRLAGKYNIDILARYMLIRHSIRYAKDFSQTCNAENYNIASDFVSEYITGEVTKSMFLACSMNFNG